MPLKFLFLIGLGVYCARTILFQVIFHYLQTFQNPVFPENKISFKGTPTSLMTV